MITSAANLRTILYGGQLEFLILDRKSAETITQSAPYILISITDPQNYELDWKVADVNCEGILRLSFSDFEEVADPSQNKTVITDQQANEITEFFLRHYDDGIRRVVIHCEMGLSRSSSVGRAISQLINGDSEEFDKFYLNSTVYDKVYNSLAKRIGVK